jgi:hypothetical protein
MNSERRKYQVFVSSTYEDLREERREVITTLLSIDCFPVCMEQFSASARPKWEVIAKLISESDYFIVIIAERYGSIDKESEISYTQKEYEYAIQQNIPAMAFVKDENELKQSQTEKNAGARKKLNDFRAGLLNERVCSPWNSTAQLCQKVTVGIVNEIKNTPRPGWVRGDAIEMEPMPLSEQLTSFIPNISIYTDKSEKTAHENILQKSENGNRAKTTQTEDNSSSVKKFAWDDINEAVKKAKESPIFKSLEQFRRNNTDFNE